MRLHIYKSCQPLSLPHSPGAEGSRRRGEAEHPHDNDVKDEVTPERLEPIAAHKGDDGR
jgi:hypothetical protein